MKVGGKVYERIKSSTAIDSFCYISSCRQGKALKAKGVDVLSLTVGEPDFVTPKNIQKAAIASIEDGRASYYTPSGGIPELKQAIVSYVEREYQLVINPSKLL